MQPFGVKPDHMVCSSVKPDGCLHFLLHAVLWAGRVEKPSVHRKGWPGVGRPPHT
jgi:hypothetical protein